MDNLIHSVPDKRIDKNAIKAWRISGFLFGLLFYLVPAIGFFVYMEGGADYWFAVISGWVALFFHLTAFIVVPGVRWRRWHYNVTEMGVDMYRGMFIIKRTMIPINRIQHVDTKQGPVYRKFGLSSIRLSTAATTHEIPALDDGTANHLRDLISTLVRQVKEDV